MDAERRSPRVLVIDDGETYARAVAESLPELTLVRPNGLAGEPRLGDGPAALAFLQQHAAEVDVVLLDMNFDVAPERLLPLEPGASPRRTRRFQGVAILREIRRRWPELPVVLLTAEEDLSLIEAAGELAAQSMTYFLDGDALDALRIRINTALHEAALGLEDADILWGRDPAMRAVRRRLAVLARGRMPVIMEGETGTGKSYLAERFVHANSGRKGPFVTLDLASIPPDLVPAHLFGAVRGAYTGAVTDRKGIFELADRGTVFIDEVQNIPPEIQKQLLVVLQERRVRPLGATRSVPVDVKVIAASNTSLAEAVAAGRFRADLYMRLFPATRVVIPPLRERPGDIELLARSLVARAADDPDVAALREQVAVAVGLPRGGGLALVVGRQRPGGAAGSPGRGALELYVPAPAWEQLLRHPWPGNMRELQSVLTNLVTFTLVAAADAVHSGLSIRSPRLQVDPGLVGELLAGACGLEPPAAPAAWQGPAAADDDGGAGLMIPVRIAPAAGLNAVGVEVERQYFLALYRRSKGDFSRMAELLLGDAGRARAVRLRFNQLGLKVRALPRESEEGG